MMCEKYVPQVTNDEIVRVDKEFKVHYVNKITEMRGDLSISKIPGVLVMKDEKVCSVF
jgi:hypothetical protein